MLDRREEILKMSVHGGVVRNGEVHCEISEAKNAMDEYMRETCLELLEYIGRNIKWTVEADGDVLFWDGKEYITKPQLFENFL